MPPSSHRAIGAQGGHDPQAQWRRRHGLWAWRERGGATPHAACARGGHRRGPGGETAREAECAGRREGRRRARREERRGEAVPPLLTAARGSARSPQAAAAIGVQGGSKGQRGGACRHGMCSTCVRTAMGRSAAMNREARALPRSAFREANNMKTQCLGAAGGFCCKGKLGKEETPLRPRGSPRRLVEHCVRPNDIHSAPRLANEGLQSVGLKH